MRISMRTLKTIGSISLLFCIIILGACGNPEEDNNSRSDTGTVVPGRDAAPSTPSATDPNALDTTAGAGKMTDANILAKLKEMNEGEVAEGTLAKDKGTHKDVKTFAQMLITDHTKMRAQGEDLAGTLKITPQPLPSDRDREEMQQAMQMLQSTPEGKGFDSMFIAHAIDMHLKTLDRLNTMREQATEERLKTHITDALPIIQRHLDRAKEIQGTLTTAAQ